MKKKLEITEDGNVKKTYIPPSIALQVIELEQGIASGSAAVNPGGSNDAVKEEWGTGTNRDGGLDW
ncbi:MULTISPECIES: hypothetical protein [Sphingobacterium]|uniref:Uncharacterized protein n=2 Tax=Sphingobacterium TaxID=28453 RepID=A0A420BGF4_SPHD1|nr:hypothetical protein [Sphingobacterium detergens]RKE55788.1 hypothetical protein DFQ12_0627 [Sphingobacterium detergens]